MLFSRPKKIPFGQNVRPKKILRTPPSLKYVSGAPGYGHLVVTAIHFFIKKTLVNTVTPLIRPTATFENPKQ